MTVLNAADPAVSLTSVLALVRRGESVLLFDGDRAVARVDPPPDGGVGDEPRSRGTYAPAAVPVPAPGVALSNRPVVLERRPIEPNFTWTRGRDGDDE